MRLYKYSICLLPRSCSIHWYLLPELIINQFSIQWSGHVIGIWTMRCGGKITFEFYFLSLFIFKYMQRKKTWRHREKTDKNRGQRILRKDIASQVGPVRPTLFVPFSSHFSFVSASVSSSFLPLFSFHCLSLK